MSGKHEKPEERQPQRQLPKFCGHGHGGSDTVNHCDNPRCTWVKCNECHRLTDVAGLIGGETA